MLRLFEGDKACLILDEHAWFLVALFTKTSKNCGYIVSILVLVVFLSFLVFDFVFLTIVLIILPAVFFFLVSKQESQVGHSSRLHGIKPSLDGMIDLCRRCVLGDKDVHGKVSSLFCVSKVFVNLY